LEILRDLGITLVQGFLFCHPVRFDQFLELLESGNLCSFSPDHGNEAC